MADFIARAATDPRADTELIEELVHLCREVAELSGLASNEQDQPDIDTTEEDDGSDIGNRAYELVQSLLASLDRDKSAALRLLMQECQTTACLRPASQ